jgi:hypothetical protein
MTEDPDPLIGIAYDREIGVAQTTRPIPNQDLTRARIRAHVEFLDDERALAVGKYCSSNLHSCLSLCLS